MGKHSCLLRFCMIPVMLSFWGCGENVQDQSDGQGAADQNTASILVASEELILDLTPRLKGFKPNIFTEDCLFVGVDPDPVQKMKYPELRVVENHWNSKKTNNKTEAVKPTIVKMTGPAGQFELGDINFSIVSGKFSDSGMDLFTSIVSFSGSNKNSSISSVNEVIWKKFGSSWKINL